MSLSHVLSTKFVAPALAVLMGRRNLVRLARSLTMASRLDVANQMESNGERLVQRIVLQHCAKPFTVFDVGANAGAWSASLLRAAEGTDGQVHAFEPASATFARLSQNLSSAAGRARLLQQALSSQKGTAQFFIAGEGLGINSLHARPGSPQKQETVTLNTVDDYCKESAIQRVHLMKIDAEGHDFSVLEGAQGMLSARAIDVVQFEYNQRWIDSRHFLKDVFDLLLPLGYLVGKVTPKGIEFYPEYHFELESFREGNYLLCLPEWKDRFPQVKWWNLE